MRMSAPTAVVGTGEIYSMPGRESDLWKHMKKQLLSAVRSRAASPYHSIYLRRVENILNDGHPDVEYCYLGEAGVIELKQRREWPKRVSTIVRLQHYTKEQQNDLKDRILAGGRVALLLQVAEDYLLFTDARVLIVGKVIRAELERAATRIWQGAINGRELLEELIA